MAGIFTNTKSDYVPLPEKLSAEVWKKAIRESAVMNLGKEIVLPGTGTVVPLVSGNGQAEFIWGNETTERTVSKRDVTQKHIAPYEIYLIQTFSNRLKDNDEALFKAMVEDGPAILGVGIDENFFTKASSQVGEHFDTVADCEEVSISSDVYHNIILAKKMINAAHNRFNGVALSTEGEAVFEDVVDNVGRPLFIPDVTEDGSIGRIRGQRTVLSDGLYIPEGKAGSGQKEQLAVMGDFSKLRWGKVDGIKAKMYDQAIFKDKEGNEINLAASHMFAIEYCLEVGIAMEDPNAFVRLTGGEPAPENKPQDKPKDKDKEKKEEK